MSDNSWWFNKAGKIAPISNPGSATPNYGLTYDLTTAPTDTPDQFDEMAAGITSYLMSLIGMPQGTGQVFHGSAQANDPSVWDTVSKGAGAVGNTAAGLFGAGQMAGDTVRDAAAENIPGVDATFDFFNVPDADQLAADADAAGLDGWEKYQAVGKGFAGETIKAISESPGGAQIFWGLEKVNEYASTSFVAATLAEDDFGLIFRSGTWGDAQQLTKDRRLNAGEAFAQMFYDKEVIQDEARFEQIRQHNTVFNFGALAFNVIGAWKVDPNVILGKGLGQARNLSVGKLAESGRTRDVQRSVLGAPSLDDAKVVADGYTNLADKLRAVHAISLYDRAQQLRLAAQNMGFEEFSRLPAFRQSAGGVTMARLFKDVADNDENWNLAFRAALGDPLAEQGIRSLRGGISDKIAAIEMRTMPMLQRDLERTEARYAKRLAEQGRPQDARIEITRFGDKWLDDEITTLRADADELAAHLATYESHESWLSRALPGLDVDSGIVRTDAPNSIFGNLDRLGGKGFAREPLSRLGGSMKVWQHDEYSPVSWAFRAPTKPFLKRVGIVSLNDVDDGAHALTNYLNQLDYVQGGTNQAARDSVLSAWAGSASDVERQVVVQNMEREAIIRLGQRHGLSIPMMDRFASEMQARKNSSWSKLSDNAIYSPIPGKDGPGYVSWTDESGALVRVKAPVDPSQLPNWHPLTNLTDLDREIRLHSDVLREMDTDLASALRAGGGRAERWTRDLADDLGSRFNGFWKPMALLSLRWPIRVVADESTRVMLLSGILPHLSKWSEAGGKAMYNTGVVRPYEWWNGRKLKVGSLTDDTLRPGRAGYDAYDYRAITNPSAVVPASELDFGKIDMARYDKLNAKIGKREQYVRSLEAHRANTRAANKVSSDMGAAVAAFTKPERPKWATDWDDALAGAESSAERGFFFDPLTPGRQLRKGFAVSAYPGRLRTFEVKPSARELNYWTQKNSDLLAVPGNRVAVWLDKDTSRWHLDVVKTTKRREDAMLVAARTESTEFYDIEDGFTRYLDEDFYGHFSSPFTKPDAVPPAGVGVDQEPLASAADAAGAEIGAAFGAGSKPTRQAVGFGTKSWRTRDGRSVRGEQVFGPDTDNPNIYFGVVSSKSAIQNLYGGHTKGVTTARQSRASSWQYIDPDNARPEDWAAAWADFVNSHVRYSPLMRRMLDGQGDDEIFDWLMRTSEGRALRKRLPRRGENPNRWVSDVREVFDHMFPTGRALEAARLGEVDPKDVLDLIPQETRGVIHGDAFKLAIGGGSHDSLVSKVVEGLMSHLATRPTDALVRHPFAATVYNRTMRNYLSSVPADQITGNVLAAASASARAKAVHEVRRTLYNIADEREGVHMLRFVSPFFQAQLEVLERYARISMEKPETVAHIAQLLSGSQQLASPFWQVLDREGNQANGYSSENQVVFQVGDTLRGVVDKFPGLKGALDSAGSVAVPVASLNLILQGDQPFLPSMGPLVTVPASEFYFRDRPELENSAVYHWMFPFGQPVGSGPVARTISAVSPAWMRRLYTAETADTNDAAFARRVSEIGRAQLLEWEESDRGGPRPTSEDALEAAKNEYRLRAASSFFLPAPLIPKSPYQFWIDQYHAYQQKFGEDADEKFYAEYGPSYYLFAQQTTKSAGMGPTVGEKKAYDKYSALVERAPELLGVLTGPFAGGEFSDSVYQWQLSTRLPGTGQNIRERLSPEEQIATGETSRGWVEYSQLASAIEAELRNRLAQGGSAYLTATSNADLAAIKASKIREIIDRNPAWQDAYNSRSSNLGTWLNQAYDVSFDPRLDGRTDIEGLRTYLISRARLQDALREREDSGVASSDQLSFDPLGNPVGDNADLAVAWISYINELKAGNLLFAEIYNRYLEDDDLSTYISPGVSGE